MIFEADKISVRYGSHEVVHQVSLSLRSGEVLCVIGPNGSGKSSLVKALAGVVDPFTGRLSLDGSPLSSRSRKEIAKHIGYVPQNLHYLTSSTVLEVVILGRRPHVHWSLSLHDLQVVEEAMKRVHVSHLADKLLSETSGGERQRVFLARTLAQEPDIFLFDEPTSSLDIKHQIEVFSMIKWLSALGKAVLVVVHDLNFAYHFADRVLLMHGGHGVTLGKADDVMTKERIFEVYGVSMEFLRSGSNMYIFPEWDKV
ncbi:MAG: ABC transporter ATP-binding protein [Methanomicrobiales archaeon]|jgi:iron complex transport system ATP-binding protein|nr:ABC transporter ATP-binding protein [Methanomicrobiales archaeon]